MTRALPVRGRESSITVPADSLTDSSSPLSFWQQAATSRPALTCAPAFFTRTTKLVPSSPGPDPSPTPSPDPSPAPAPPSPEVNDDGRTKPPVSRPAGTGKRSLSPPSPPPVYGRRLTASDGGGGGDGDILDDPWNPHYISSEQLTQLEQTWKQVQTAESDAEAAALLQEAEDDAAPAAAAAGTAAAASSAEPAAKCGTAPSPLLDGKDSSGSILPRLRSTLTLSRCQSSFC